jgi:cell division septation protein DedD
MLFAALAFSHSDAAAQPVTLEYQQVMTRTIPGATAALSLDPSRVGASAQNGEVTLVGRGPGLTSVIVVIGDHTETLQVLVGDPPTFFLPGLRTAGSNGAQTGHYEVRYGSDPGIVQGNLRFSRREGDRSTELALGGASPLADATASPFSIPLASYSVRTPNREITLLDRVVANSPLTVSRSNVRGLHLQEGPWHMHAGYSFFANFEHLLLPTNKESVAGIGYRYRLNARSSLTPNVYYFDVAPQGRRSGPLSTLLYEARSTGDLKFTAELGVSRVVGGALEIEVDRPSRRAWAKLRFAPAELPSLSADQQSGRQVEGGWTKNDDKVTVNANVSSLSYMQGTFGQTSTLANLDLQRRLTQSWAIHGGSGYSIFENALQSASKVHNVSLPVGTAFSRRHVGFGTDYQFSRETTRDLAGHLVSANFNAGAGGFRFSVNGERQTHAPTVRQIFTEVSWLQPMLDRIGLAANTPQQLADLLRTNAELSAFGYANNITIDVTPMRTRLGATGGWSGSGSMRPQLFASTLFNRDELTDRTSLGAVHSVTYSQRLGGSTEVFLTWSALCNDRFRISSSCRPAAFLSLRRTLSSAPGLLMPRRGSIQGTVFQDDQGRGTYTPGVPTLAGVEVLLDDVRHTRTDRSGRFRFDDVPYGRHRVEARYASAHPTFFTTPSPAEVDTGGFVHFGIGRTRSSIRGTVLTDAGSSLPGVLVHVASADRQLTVRTADDGTFIAQGLPAGVYDVTIEAGSVPAGYPVDTLAPQRVRVEETGPGRAAFVLRPYRSVSGRTRLFNRETGRYEPLSEATVELRPLGRRSVTDVNGLFAFRDVPSGEFTIVAMHNEQARTSAVSVPDGPVFIKDMDLALVPAGERVAVDAPLRASITDERATLVKVNSSSTPDPQPRQGSGIGDQGSGIRDQRSESRAARRIPDPEPRIPVPGFTIQVAASTNARHARAMVNELKEAGHAAYLVEPPPSSRGAPYHVRVGHYATLAEADRSARTLEKALGWRLTVTAGVPPHLVAQGKAVSYGG